VRRKGKYVNETFRRRKDAEEWALEVERHIDRGEFALARSSRDTKTFADLIKLHREDLQEVGKPIGRSKAASLALLERRLGQLRVPELDRGRLILFGKERAREGAGPVTLFSRISQSSSTTRRVTTLREACNVLHRPRTADRIETPEGRERSRLSVRNRTVTNLVAFRQRNFQRL